MKKSLLLVLLTILSMSVSHAAYTTIIDNLEYTVDTLQHTKVGPGAYYTSIKFSGEKYTFRTFYLAVETKQPNVEIRTELGRDTVIGCEWISSHANRKTNEKETYFAAVNGDFWATSGEIGTPSNTTIQNGVMSADVYDPWPLFYMDTDANPYISFVKSNETIKINDQAPIALSHVNGHINTNQLVLFNSTVGNFTHTPAGTLEIALELLPNEKWLVNAPIKAKVVGKASTTGNRMIVEGQAVLAANGTSEAVVKGLKEGDIVEIMFNQSLNDHNNITPRICQGLGGNVIFVRNGAPVQLGDKARHPRTMVGYTKDHGKVILAVVDGRSPISSGAMYSELADMMIWAGADYAINIDGGGSSSLFLRDFGAMNVPSDGKERAVGNGIYCVAKTEGNDSIVTEIQFKDWAMNFPKYGIYTPVFYGYNKAGLLVDTNVQGVKLSCDPKVGKIINDGATFYGDNNGSTALTATFKNCKPVSIPVTVSPSDKAKIRLSNVVIDNKREYPVEVLATVLEKDLPLNPSALVWKSNNEEVASIGATTGILKGLKNGTAVVNGAIGSFSGNLNVKVEIPTATTMPVNYPTFPNDWKLKQTGGKGITIAELEDGFKLDYTGNGAARGAYISVERPMVIWSLPEAIRITVNPGNATIKKVSMNAENAIGGRIASWVFTTKTLPQNTPTTFELNLSDWCDPKDIGIYPIQINSLRFDMGPSKKDTQFSISVPSFVAVYPQMGGIENNFVEISSIKVYPNPVNAGENINVVAEGKAEVNIFAANGTKVLTEAIEGNATISTQNFQAGIYVMNVTEAGAVKTTKLIVR